MRVSEKYYCSNCREPLKQKNKCCPRCGCKHRDIEVGVKDEIGLKGCMRIRFKPKGKKTAHETLKGWRTSGDKDKYPEGVDILREIDRDRNIYREIVRDRRTNEIVHENTEPLNHHRT
jgi:hypothetical protein